MSKSLAGSVVVITGASSGIGRATALEFARQGANVVVAARREQPLRTLAEECTRMGVQALAVPTDVSKEEAVRNLAQEAHNKFGRIDVWVNNAGVGVYGRIEEIPTDAYLRAIEIDLFGTIYGARAVIPYFYEQGHGTLINNASLLGSIGAPYYSAYAVSKFGIRGLSESLRQELEVLKGPGFSVCTILPATIDTPFFQHAANYAGRALKPLPPVYDVEMVAHTIVNCARKPKREVFVGGMGRMLHVMHRLAPGFAERIMAQQVDKGHFKDAPAAPSSGNLFAPLPEGTGTTGGWHGKERKQSRRVATASLAALVPTLLFAAWLWKQRRTT